MEYLDSLLILLVLYRSQSVLLVVSRALPIHTTMYVSACICGHVCGKAAPGNEELLQVFKRDETPQLLCRLENYILPDSLTHCQTPPDWLLSDTMSQCLHPILLCIADLVSRYPSANEEFPDDDTRFPLHSSFEDLEQAAEGGCELCGLILKTFKSVDGRDTNSWEWPRELLEKQSGGDISVHHLVKQLPDSIDTQVRMYIGTSGTYGAGAAGGPPVLDILLVHVGPSGKHFRKLPTLKLKLRTLHRLGSAFI